MIFSQAGYQQAPLVVALLIPFAAPTQVFTLTNEQLIAYTADNPYERFPDVRPKVPDDRLSRVKACRLKRLTEWCAGGASLTSTWG